MRSTVVLGCLLLTGCAAGSSAQPQPSPTVSPVAARSSIWFQPLPPPAAWPNGPPYGSTDFPALFAPNALWPHVMARTSVLGLYAGWVAAASDASLGQVAAFLKLHNIGIQLEAPALQATSSCGSGVEGYVAPTVSVRDATLGYLQRLKAIGADVRFIKVDEPLFFGSVVSDPRACHLSVDAVASQVGQYVQIVHSIYPGAAVGDVEPIPAGAYSPDAVTAIGAWLDTYKTVTGAPFPFFMADMDFSNPVWAATAKALENASRQRGMRFGIIYIGDPQDASDAQWTGKVVSRFTAYEQQSGGRPDYVLFQSWEQHPTLCLPETNATTFTGAIYTYLNAPFR